MNSRPKSTENTFKKTLVGMVTGVALTLSGNVAVAADYALDVGHSFVQFRILHLGYSWLYGRFNEFDGAFSYDASSPSNNKINLEIQTASIDTNHTKRDEHIRSADFLDVAKFPTATFVSSGYSGSDDGGVIEGELTLMGVTKPIKIDVKKIGAGPDPWGGERVGFEGTTVINRKDFGMAKSLGPKGWDLEMTLGIEGTKKK